jgi:hypothetical protein
MSETRELFYGSPFSMPDVIEFADGGYRYIKAVFQYSGGVAAMPGHEIERVRMAKPLPLKEGFEAVENHLRAIGRPLKAFCACELRSPAPFTEQGFKEFNVQYVGTLQRWGLYREGNNTVARTTVCPAFGAPFTPSMYAFSYTVPGKNARRTNFIIAGSGEAQEGRPSYRESIVRLGDVSLGGMRQKMRYVVAEMERRLTALGLTWADAVSTQAYTVHDIGPLVGDEVVRRGAATGGLTWHFCRPPIVDLEYEMDVRGAARELVL